MEKDRARYIFGQYKKAPQMYASTREAFLAGVCGILSVFMEDFDTQAFYVKHLGISGNLYIDYDKSVETIWAEKVCDDALQHLVEIAQTSGKVNGAGQNNPKGIK